MKILGIHLLKGQIRYTLLSGTKEEPILIEKEKVPVISTPDIPELMNWFDSNFREIIEDTKPNRIAYRITLNPKKEQLFNLEFPFGILNLICYQKNIEINSYVSQNYTGKRLGKSRDTDLYELCDTEFGINPPHWDKNQKNSLLIAWFELPN